MIFTLPLYALTKHTYVMANTAMNKKYNRQQTTHLLPVPFEISEHINSFCFYDVKTAETMKRIKEKKKEIMYRFEFARVSRKRPGDYFQNMEENETSETCERWALCLDNFDIWFGEERLFESANCKRCGNYKLDPYEETQLPQRILCNCNPFNV